MKYTAQSHITSIKDVQDFARYLYNERKVAFHPDDDFSEYIHSDSKEALFSESEISIFNRLINECFTVCEQNDKDIYETMIKFNPIYNYFQESAV